MHAGDFALKQVAFRDILNEGRRSDHSSFVFFSAFLRVDCEDTRILVRERGWCLPYGPKFLRPMGLSINSSGFYGQKLSVSCTSSNGYE